MLAFITILRFTYFCRFKRARATKFDHANAWYTFKLIFISKNHVIKGCNNTNIYFREEYTPKIIKSRDGKAIIPGSKPLSLQIQEKSFA